MLPSEISRTYFLTAGDTDAQGRMPIWLIATRVIEIATLHANELGVGYDALSRLGIGWVLSRVSIEMARFPGINETYTVTTWIEDYNRLYSDRCFAISDAQGNVVGNVRSMWVAIDMKTRKVADLSALDRGNFVVSQRRSPVVRAAKQRPLGPEADEVLYTFGFSDIDFNRHVNTVQYIRHVLNQWPMRQYDANEVARFDIQFLNECRYGEQVRIRHIDTGERSLCEIVAPDGRNALTAAITWRGVANKFDNPKTN